MRWQCTTTLKPWRKEWSVDEESAWILKWFLNQSRRSYKEESPGGAGEVHMVERVEEQDHTLM